MNRSTKTIKVNSGMLSEVNLARGKHDLLPIDLATLQRWADTFVLMWTGVVNNTTFVQWASVRYAGSLGRPLQGSRRRDDDDGPSVTVSRDWSSPPARDDHSSHSTSADYSSGGGDWGGSDGGGGGGSSD